MPNRNLNAEELARANALLTEIRERLRTLAGEDDELHFAFRRKIYKELTYDERAKPMVRKLLKAHKMGEQKGLCAICAEELPDKYAVLDRLNGMHGYTKENTRLICSSCDTRVQAERRYS